MLHRRVAATHLGNHNRPRKSFFTHWPGIETTYIAAITVKIFAKRSSLSGYLRLLKFTGNLQIEATDSTKELDIPGAVLMEQRRKLLQKIGQTLFELVRRVQNIAVFKKNLIRAATDIVESRLFRSQRIAFSEDKTCHFQSLDLQIEPMDNPKTRYSSLRPQKLKNNPTYTSASGCAVPKTAPYIPRRPVDLFWQNMKFFCNILPKKVLSELEKNGSRFFYSRVRMKVELTCKNGKTVEIHLTRDQKVTFDY